MLYEKNNTPKLEKELFENPTAEYRGAPFWAWNSKLDRKELARQIEIFKQMGFGGFHMHVRQGLETAYLSEEFLSVVRFCTEKAEKEEMLAYLYDEDRWPSGVAGGEVTKTLANRQKFLTMTVNDRKDCADTIEDAANTGKPYFLAAFDLSFNEQGVLQKIEKIERNAVGVNKRYFFVEQQQGGEPRYNYQAYVDTLKKSAIDTFISLTHEKLKGAVGDKFSKTIPSIFTDEPQYIPNFPPKSATDIRDTRFAWTTDFDKTYYQEYSSDIIDYLPYLFFASVDEKALSVRFNYYTHLTERFCKAYMDNIGDWCEKNQIMMTGHVMGEDTLYEQALSTGDAMRTYKNMQLPGIDLLCDDVSFVTPLQCRSVVRQYGREAMLSELYGVTGWDFDFRGHKYQGDWQACLGVTLRVPHLAWQSMKGEGKRDYPAPISYQSPWYKEYKYLEDHYARINTALTRGTPEVDIAIIHPIDSYKINYASVNETWAFTAEIERDFQDTAQWLLSGGFEFDYISESLLPEICAKGDNPLCVGKMKYKTIILSNSVTLRPHTLKVLEEFKANGGQIIIKGIAPYMMNGVPSKEVQRLLVGATIINNLKSDLYAVLDGVNHVDVRNQFGERTKNLMFTVRKDRESKWIFGAHMYKAQLPHLIEKEQVTITVNGIYTPYLYDTLSGKITRLNCAYKGDKTLIDVTVYNLDTLLIKLEPKENGCEFISKENQAPFVEIDSENCVDYRLSEPNVLLLDYAKYSVDGKEFVGPEEIMRIDDTVRKQFNLQSRRTKFVQPWAVNNSPEDHTVKLLYEIESEIVYNGAMLATEHPHTLTISFNGKKISNQAVGYYVDKDIKTIKLPKIKKGVNTLEITMPFGLRTDLEASYLIGDFAVQAIGVNTKIVKKQDKLYFGDVTRQGLAFYGGNIDYDIPVEIDCKSDVKITATHYRGALISILVDGATQGRIVFPPYELTVKGVDAGKHVVTVRLHGTRYNTFSALHSLWADKKRVYMGPDFWRSVDEGWSYEYNTRPMGVLKTPVISVCKCEE